MTKFLAIYNGAANDLDKVELSEEQQSQFMQFMGVLGASTRAGLPTRAPAGRPVSIPASRSLRHSVICDEHNP